MTTRRITSFVAVVTTLAALALAPAAAASRIPPEPSAASPLVAKVTLRGGQQRTVVLQGVGCSISMCSRVVVHAEDSRDALVHKTRLDAIAAIKDINGHDALFVFKDGTERRLSVTEGNRVFYVANRTGGEKIDLAQSSSLEFVTGR